MSDLDNEAILLKSFDKVPSRGEIMYGVYAVIDSSVRNSTVGVRFFWDILARSQVAGWKQNYMRVLDDSTFQAVMKLGG